MYICFNILTCQDEQGFVCRAYPNSVMYPLTEKQATHKASKQSSSYIGLRPPFGPFPMIDELKQAFFFFLAVHLTIICGSPFPFRICCSENV